MASPETLFKAMADTTRQRTLRILKGQELSVSELVQVLGQPQSTVSRHLRTLHDAGLIGDRRDGATVLYSVRSSNNGGGSFDLPDRLLEWVGCQALPKSVGRRLEVVLDHRREMSEKFFDRVGRHWDSLREESFGRTFHLEAMLSLLPEEWTVADIGTGTGYMLPILARRFRRVIGVEPVDKMIEIARHRLERCGAGNVELRKGGLAELPVNSAAVDLAIAMLVLHHVPSPRRALCELHRILKEGRRVLIVEQDAHSNEAFRERMQDRWWGFEPDELAAWVRSAGFGDVQTLSLAPGEGEGDSPALFVVTAYKKSKEKGDAREEHAS